MKVYLMHVCLSDMRCSGGRIRIEDDEPAGQPKSMITDQNITNICDMSEFPLASMLKGSSKTGESSERPSKSLVLKLLPVPAPVSSSSLDHGSKLRGSSPNAFV
ncbi:hypothetical protein TNCV_4041781 [Trichonephila clavipes]|nr:hypothetical protein TNCV_4041781 [Trichonephila clavipes]